MKVVVVPTNREEIKDFLDDWGPVKDWDEIIVVEDNPTKTLDLGLEHHYSWQEIQDDLQKDSWIISRRDSAIRCYGFLVAYRLGATYTFSLDDDCRHLQGKWCADHVSRLDYTDCWVESVLGQRTRGMPYENLGDLENVMFNMGLWTGIPDFDSIQSLSEKNQNTEFQPPECDRIIPRGQYFPFCGMNFAFNSEATPLCYFPLMGEGSPFSRFDDIWFGIIAKKICDHLGWHMSVGRPFVEHLKLSNRFDNLVKEAPGIKFNEEFWQIIDDMELNKNDALGCMREIANQLEHRSLYIPQLGLAIQTWCDVIEGIKNERETC
jgi:reversibly glycosylated polypeptide/UDP-arabinopyranose mutase